MMFGVVVLLIFVLGVVSTAIQYGKQNLKGMIASIAATIALGIVTSFLYARLESAFQVSEEPTPPVLTAEQEMEEHGMPEKENGKEMQEIEDPEEMTDEEVANLPEEQKVSPPEELGDVTGLSTIRGRVTEQENRSDYRLVASVSGTYRFETDRSAGVDVNVRIGGETGNYIDSGINGLTIDLEEGKTYWLSVEYLNGVCDYAVDIGIPAKIHDVTLQDAVFGAIRYQGQNDRYRYTALRDGRYRFDVDCSAGVDLYIRVCGENGNFIDGSINGMTMELEEGETYLINVVYQNGLCDYALNIGVPMAVCDVTGCSAVSGVISYRDQSDRYLFTASVDGTYRFETDRSPGVDVGIRICGENGNYIFSGVNELWMDLQAGKKYMICAEYQNGQCDYILLIHTPLEEDDSI